MHRNLEGWINPKRNFHIIRLGPLDPKHWAPQSTTSESCSWRNYGRVSRQRFMARQLKWMTRNSESFHFCMFEWLMVLHRRRVKIRKKLMPWSDHEVRGCSRPQSTLSLIFFFVFSICSGILTPFTLTPTLTKPYPNPIPTLPQPHPNTAQTLPLPHLLLLTLPFPTKPNTRLSRTAHKTKSKVTLPNLSKSENTFVASNTTQLASGLLGRQ